MPRRRIEENTALPSVGGRIRLLRERRGLEQKELAGRLGVTANAVSNWEHGRGRPDLNLLPALAGALDVTLYELFGLDTAEGHVSPDELRFIARFRELNAGHRTAVDRMLDALLDAQAEEGLPPIRVLTYYGRRLSAGPGDPTEFDEEGTPLYVCASPETERAGCVFTVSGDSMEPSFRSGDMVLVSRIPDAPALQYGEVGAFIAGNETYIKVYGKDGLHSLNPAYPTLTFDESTPVFLIGRVMGRLDPHRIVPEAEAERRLAAQK